MTEKINETIILNEVLNNIINNIVNEVVQSNKTKRLLDLVRNHRNNIFDYERKIKMQKNIIKQLQYEIYNTCNHNWERDWDDPYSRYKVCSKCKLANMPYVYKCKISYH